MTSPQAKAGCFSVGRCISPLERKEAVEAYRRLDEKPSDADRQASIRRCPRLGSSSGELETTVHAAIQVIATGTGWPKYGNPMAKGRGGLYSHHQPVPPYTEGKHNE